MQGLPRDYPYRSTESSLRHSVAGPSLLFITRFQRVDPEARHPHRQTAGAIILSETGFALSETCATTGANFHDGTRMHFQLAFARGQVPAATTKNPVRVPLGFDAGPKSSILLTWRNTTTRIERLWICQRLAVLHLTAMHVSRTASSTIFPVLVRILVLMRVTIFFAQLDTLDEPHEQHNTSSLSPFRTRADAPAVSNIYI